MQAGSTAWVRVVAWLMLLASAAAGLAQSAVDGAVGGHVVDQRGLSIAGAVVMVESAALGVSRNATTGQDGEFLLVKLVPGIYTVTVTAAGFGSVSQRVTVELGSIAAADQRLALAAVLTELNVDAAPVPLPGQADLETTETTAQTGGPADGVTAIEQVEQLPVEGRRWQSYALLLPSVNGGTSTDSEAAISFRGLATTQNSSEIDGASDDQSFGAVAQGTGAGSGREAETEDDSGGPTGAGGDGARGLYGRHAGAAYTFAQGAVQEFRIHTDNYSALDGHAAGGVVTTISKSGGNVVKGSLFYLARNSAWGATNPFSTVTRYNDGVVTNTLAKPPDLRQQFGGSVGGSVVLPRRFPIHGPKLFYFATVDVQRRGFPAVSSPGYNGFLRSLRHSKRCSAIAGFRPQRRTRP